MLIKAGLFADVPEMSLPNPDSLDAVDWNKQRRLIAKKISRLQNINAGNQSMLQNLVFMRDWLQGRPADYREWVLPCLDYLFSTLITRHGPAVPELLVKAGFFDFASFQQNFIQTEQKIDKGEEPEIVKKCLELLRSLNPNDIGVEEELSIVTLLLHYSEADNDHLYVDGSQFCDTVPRKIARESALRLIDHGPKSGEFHSGLGFSLLMLGEYANAIVCFQRQLNHAPEDGVIYDNLAWCQMKLGRLADALSNASKARALAPEKVDIHHDYAGILMLLGRHDEALEVTTRTLQDFPDGAPQLLYLHAKLLDRSGLKEQATLAWRCYLRRVQRLSGHQKAISRAVAALEECGCQHVFVEYPIRRIADDALLQLENRIDGLFDCLRQYGISANELHDLKKKVEVFGSEEKIQNHCRRMLDAAERDILTSYLITEEGKTKIHKMFAQRRSEWQSNETTASVVLRDFVKPLLDNIISQIASVVGRGNINLYRDLSNRRIEVDSALALSGWYSFCELIKKPDGEIPSLCIVENLLVAWQRGTTEQRPKGIRPLGMLAELCKIKPEIVTMLESGENGFRCEKIESWRAEYELEAKKAQEAIEEGQARLAEAEKIFWEEEKRLKEDRNEANVMVSRWGNTKHQAETMTVKVEQLTQEVAKCARLKRASGFWAMLNNHGRMVAEAALHVSQLAEQLIRSAPGVPVLASFPKTPDAVLTRLKNEIPAWICGVQEHLRKQAQEGDRQMAIGKASIKETDRFLKERQTAFQQARQQAKAEERNQTVLRDQAQKIVNALRKIENEALFREFIPGRNIIAMSVADIDQTTSSLGPSYLFYGGITDGMAAFREIDASWHKDLFQHKGGATGFVLHPSGELAASAGMDGQIAMWTIDLQHNVQQVQTISVGRRIYSIAFGDKHLFAGTENQILVYAMPDLDPAATIDTVEGKIFSLACDDKRGRLYVLGTSFEIPSCNTLNLLDMSDGSNFRTRKCMRGFSNLFLSMSIDPTGRWIAAGEGVGGMHAPESSRVFVWDASTLRLRTVFTCHEGWVDSVAFSPDGRWLLSGDGTGPIDDPKPSKFYLHHLESQRTLLAVEAHKGWVRSFAFVGRGRFLLSGGSDGIWCWDFTRLTAGLVSDVVLVDLPPLQGPVREL